MPTITTKYLGPTDFKGARISVTADTWGSPTRMIVSYDYELSAVENHTKPAQQMAKRLGWSGVWQLADHPDRKRCGYVFVRIVEHYQFKVEEAP